MNGAAPSIEGIHHVTALASDPQRNLDFYSGLLGLRLVKRTVNFDDPGRYHLYYGDSEGTPGTLLSFFAYPGGLRGRAGNGQVDAVALAVLPRSLAFWADRLRAAGAALDPGPDERGAIAVRDPDGLHLELVPGEGPPAACPWAGGGVPAEHAIRGVHLVRFSQEGLEASASLLVDVLGFRQIAQDGAVTRFAVGPGGSGSLIEVLCRPAAPPGRLAIGSVHHVALRLADAAGQRAWGGVLAGRGLNVTPVIDRRYFRSIYFREPGGVMLEIASAGPGFHLDEAPGELGEKLSLPPWLGSMRGRLMRRLPPLTAP